MNRREFLAAVAAVSVRQTVVNQLDELPVTLIREPYIQNIRQDGTSILWAGRNPANGVLAYSTDGINFNGVQAGVRIFSPTETGGLPQFTQFRADLTGLTPDTNYVYQLYMDAQFVTQGRFRTAGDGPFSFLVFGDTGQLTLNQQFIAGRLSGESSSFLLHVGDIAYFSGSYREFQTNHFDVYKDVFPLLPYFPCPGNHEYVTPGAAPYIAQHAVPTQNVPVQDRGRYYSFDWSNVHFICLDSNDSLESAARGTGEMLRWLENDLRATRKFWRVAAFHHPPYAGGFNQNDPLSSLARQHIVPILEAYGVQLVLNGHEHSYQRSYDIRRGAGTPAGTGTLYITSGGGGAALYPVTSHPLIAFGRSAYHYLRIDVSGTAMAIEAIGVDGAAIDRFVLRPQPALTEASGEPLVANGVNNPAVSLIRSGSRTLVRIRGRSLAAEEYFVGRVPGPTELGGTSVTANGLPVQLIYVSSTQIWGQLPPDIPVPFLLSVVNANGYVQTSVG
jgi:hypothetical protein